MTFKYEHFRSFGGIPQIEKILPTVR